VDRRTFLSASTGAALVSGLAGDEKAFSQVVPGTGEPQIDLLDQADSYLQNAIANASSLARNVNALNMLYDQGNQLFLAIQTELDAIGFEFTLDGIVPDTTSPLPSFSEFLALEQSNLAALNQGFAGVNDQATALAKRALAKLLGIIGIKDVAEVIYNLLNVELGELGAALAAKNWKKAAAVTGKILKTLISPAFLKLLGEHIGVTRAGKIVAKIAGRLVPFVGWAILIGQLIWALGEEAF
jgi:hypothetical protein